jgi:hypothetical protein
VKLLEIDALDDRSELTSILLEILYHDGIDLNAWFKDSAAICYLFGALDWVRDALIPTWGVKRTCFSKVHCCIWRRIVFNSRGMRGTTISVQSH